MEGVVFSLKPLTHACCFVALHHGLVPSQYAWSGAQKFCRLSWPGAPRQAWGLGSRAAVVSHQLNNFVGSGAHKLSQFVTWIISHSTYCRSWSSLPCSRCNAHAQRQIGLKLFQVVCRFSVVKKGCYMLSTVNMQSS